MNWQAIKAIVSKDIRSIFSNWQVWSPMLVLPLLFAVIMPIGVLLAAGFATGAESSSFLNDLADTLSRIASPTVQATLNALPSLGHKLAYFAMNYGMAPLFLIIPLMASTGVSAQSFAGEKETSTMESLLFAPVDLLSLFVGKVLAALVPALGLSLGSFVLFGITANATGWHLFHSLFFPTANWLPLMLLVIPALSLVTILFSVYISSRVATFQAAYQSGGIVVLPILALMGSQLGGALTLDLWVTALIGLVLGILAFLLMRLFGRKLDRSALFESQIR
ncbi:MAG: transporter permease protein [Symbiobacteriaceae bacterium]|jgi:ABC-type Na+ efflux pump permease subunit|nr:transporter permease protein [Symbiobacteriaceae bacterium]